MTTADVKRLLLAMAIQADIEAMKARNREDEKNNYHLRFTHFQFQQKAEEIRQLASKPDDQL